MSSKKFEINTTLFRFFYFFLFSYLFFQHVKSIFYLTHTFKDIIDLRENVQTCYISKRYGILTATPVGGFPLFGDYPPFLLLLYLLPFPCETIIFFLSFILPLIVLAVVFLLLWKNKFEDPFFAFLVTLAIFHHPHLGIGLPAWRVRSFLSLFFIVIGELFQAYSPIFFTLALASQPAVFFIFYFFSMRWKKTKWEIPFFIFLFIVFYFRWLTTERIGVGSAFFNLFTPKETILSIIILSSILCFASLYIHGLALLLLSFLPLKHHSLLFLPFINSTIMPVYFTAFLPFLLKSKEKHELLISLLVLYSLSITPAFTYLPSLNPTEFESGSFGAGFIVEKYGDKWLIIQGDPFLYFPLLERNITLCQDPIGHLGKCKEAEEFVLCMLNSRKNCKYPESFDFVYIYSFSNLSVKVISNKTQKKEKGWSIIQSKNFEIRYR